MNAEPTLNEILFYQCINKECCRDKKVIVTGYDVWNISQKLDIYPTDFTKYTEAIDGAMDGFLFNAKGNKYQIILSVKEDEEQKKSCIFLWQLNNGHSNCGLGDNKPMACKTYPYIISNGRTSVGMSNCNCTNWSLHHTDIHRMEQMLHKRIETTLEYSRLVMLWNKRVQSDKMDFSYTDFTDFIFSFYSSKYGIK